MKEEERKKADEISIHAAREGGDDGSQKADAPLRISIHAAREGGDCGNE